MVEVTEYLIDPETAALLLGALHLQEPDRTNTLVRLLPGDEGARALAQFIGLAASVYANARDFMHGAIVCEVGHDPNYVEKWNFPTLTGALLGCRTAHGVDQDGLCEGCAFRHGTHANQSEVTNLDARGLVPVGEDPFFCHLDLSTDGTPTRACVGWARSRRAAMAEREPRHDC